MNEKLEQITNELNDEQLKKLKDIEIHPDCFGRLENKPKEEIINYIDRWVIRQHDSLEGDGSSEAVETNTESTEEPKEKIKNSYEPTIEEIEALWPEAVFENDEELTKEITDLKIAHLKKQHLKNIKEENIKKMKSTIKQIDKDLKNDEELLNMIFGKAYRKSKIQ